MICIGREEIYLCFVSKVKSKVRDGYIISMHYIGKEEIYNFFKGTHETFSTNC